MRGSGPPHRGEFPVCIPDPWRDTLCRAQHPAALSRGAAELGLAGNLCQSCGKGLPLPGAHCGQAVRGHLQLCTYW